MTPSVADTLALLGPILTEPRSFPVCGRCRSPVASYSLPRYCDTCFPEVAGDAIRGLESRRAELARDWSHASLELVAAMARSDRMAEAAPVLRAVLDRAPEIEVRIVAALLLARGLDDGTLELAVTDREQLRSQLLAILVKAQHPVTVESLSRTLGLSGTQLSSLIAESQRWLRGNPLELTVVRRKRTVALARGNEPPRKERHRRRRKGARV